MNSRRLPVAAIFLCLSLSAAAVAAEIPEGATLMVRLDSSVSSKTAQVGDRVAGTLAEDLVADGQVVAPRGTRVWSQVTFAREAGRLRTTGYLTLRLASMELGGKTYALQSTPVRREGKGHTRDNVTKIGGGTAAGAVIGGIAGGGKGAAIGAAIGAGGGTAVAATTGDHDALIRAETVLSFTTTAAARAE
jgi:hypothetical protein